MVLLGPDAALRRLGSATTTSTLQAIADKNSHLTSYNSTVWSSFGTYEYMIASITESFTHNATLTDDMFTTEHLTYGDAKVVRSLQQEAVAGKLERLENDACIDAYAQLFQGTNGHVLLVAADNKTNSATPYMGHIYSGIPNNDAGNNQIDAYGWICGGVDFANPCTGQKLAAVRSNSSTWTTRGFQVDYCLSQKPQSHCKLQLNEYLLIIVIAFNMLKVTAMAITALTTKGPLLNIGDAISSFLEQPDETTRNLGPVSKRNVIGRRQPWSMYNAVAYESKRTFWFRAASLRRWIILNIA